MSKLLLFINIFLIGFVLFDAPAKSIPSQGIEQHLLEFAHINQTHHDNIDDNWHVHSHKHSENEKEHDHHHEHSKLPQADLKLSPLSISLTFNTVILLENSFFSTPNFKLSDYLSDILRPPIS